MSEKPSTPQKKPVTLKRHQIIELLVLAGIIVLLLLYLILRSAGSFSYKLPQFEEVLQSEIQSIHWSRKDGSEQSLRKEGDTWYIGTQKYPAKQSYIDTLVQQLSRPALQDLVSKSGRLLTYALDEQRVFLLQAANDEEETLRKLYVGKSSGRYSYVRLNADDSHIYTLSENLTSILEKNTDDLRDRSVVKFSSGDIQKVELRETGENGRSISAEKKDKEWQLPEGLTEEQVQQVVNRFSSMNAQSFIPEYPQSDNDYQLQFTAVGGVIYTVNIAAEALGDDAGYAAKSSSYGFPFTLNNYTVESMLKDFGFIEESGQ